MSTRVYTEDQRLLPNLPQPTGKIGWIIGSAVSFGGTIGVGYVSIKSFIAGAVVNGGILGAGSLICAGACAYCCYRVVDALRTRSIESVEPTFDESTTKAHFLILRTIYNQLTALLQKDVSSDLEEVVTDVGLPGSINLQLTELSDELRELRNIKPVLNVATVDENVVMLRMVYTRLNKLLYSTTSIDLDQSIDDTPLDEFGNQQPIIDLEQSIDDTALCECINQQLAELELLLPDMREDLAKFKEIVETELANRSIASASISGFNSPSNDSSADRGLFSKLEALAKKVEKDQSRSASRYQSAYSSPAVYNKNSNLNTSLKVENNSSSVKKNLTFAINSDETNHLSDSDEG